jgi:ferrous-iron efflux pump FieF
VFCCHDHSHTHDAAKNEDVRWLKIAAYSVFFSTLVLIVCRAVAYYATMSLVVAMSIADAVKDGIFSLLNAFFVIKSVKPANEKYPFGYGKIGALLAMFQAMLLCAIGAGALFNSFSEYHELKRSAIAYVAFGLSIVGVIYIATIQAYVYRKTKSLAIRADAAHYKSDLVIDIGIFASLFVSCSWLDATLGCLMAAYLGWVSFFIGRTAINTLLDKSLPPEVVQKVRDLAEAAGGNVHSIRTHSLGRGEFILIDLHDSDESRPGSQATTVQDLKKKQERIKNVVHEHFHQALVVVALSE